MGLFDNQFFPTIKVNGVVKSDVPRGHNFVGDVEVEISDDNRDANIVIRTISSVEAFATSAFWDDFTMSPTNVWTANANGALVVDGVDLAVGDRVATDYTYTESKFPIGIVTDAGSASTPAVVSFVTQPSTPFIFTVLSGAVYAGTLWRWPGPTAAIEQFVTDATAITANYSDADRTAALTAQALWVLAPAGLYEVEVYVAITTTGSAGTIDTSITSVDDIGSNVQSFSTSVTATNRSRQRLLVESDGSADIVLDTVHTGVTGTPHYSIRVHVRRVQ